MKRTKSTPHCSRPGAPKHRGQRTSQTGRVSRKEQIRQHPFFTLLPPEAAPRLAATARITRFPAEAVIFQEGTPADCLYLVLDGSVRILKAMTDTAPYLLTRVESGGFFGEYGALDNSVRSAAAVAAVDATLARIPREPFLAVIQALPASALLRFVHHMLNGIRASNNHYVAELVQRARISAVGASLSAILHDFRTPLGVVGLTAGLLRRQQTVPDVVKAGLVIGDQVRCMDDLLNDTIDYARGTVRMTRIPTSLVTILEQARQQLGPSLEKAGIRLELAPRAVWIHADARKILRILQNLVKNAAEMFPRGGGRIRIRVTTHTGWVVLSVSDNGPGLPEGIRTRLFEPFTTAGKQGGIGLGLPIVKAITTAHGGEIRVATAAGRGTTFHMQFPRIHPDGKPWTRRSA
jgi:signal transduction histidine kinase